MNDLQPVLVSVETARTLLGNIGKTTVFKMLSNGELESVRLGTRRLIRVSSIKAVADRTIQD